MGRFASRVMGKKMVAAAGRFSKRKTGGFTSRRGLGDLRALAVQESEACFVSSCLSGENRLSFTPDSRFPSPDLRVHVECYSECNTTAVVGYEATSGTWNVVQRYPGAAAHTRLGGGTGFRGVEEAIFASGSSLHLNINGANTYQFVIGNPVGRVDATGLAPQDAVGGSYLSGWHSNPYASGPLPPYVGATPNAAPSSPGPLTFPNNFLAGMGRFTVDIGPEQGSPFRSDVEVKFIPSAQVTRRCDREIEAIQFVETTECHTWGTSGGTWHIDNGEASYGKATYFDGQYPFYSAQATWRSSAPQFPLWAGDAPGGFVRSATGFQQEWKLYAVCTAGPDKGKSFGYASWGWTIYWGFWTHGGDPAGTHVTRWVEGVTRTGNATQNVAVDREGIAPLPGGVSWGASW